jgi:hypothetical protein
MGGQRHSAILRLALAGGKEEVVMDTFRVNCNIVHVQQVKRTVRVSKLLVDIESELTWILEEALKRAGISVVNKDVPFLMANGQTITRSIGFAIIRADGFQTVDEVVFGQPGDLSMLGSRTLEGFGATVDPQKKKLVAAGPRPAS